MARFISHRGNLTGPDPANENKTDYLINAYNKGHYVECDVQTHNGVLYFGHDEPQETINWQFITKTRVFCHAKDLESFVVLYNLNTNCFWHQQDDITVTSKGFIWCYPGIHVIHGRAIWLDLYGYDLPKTIPDEIFGICGDTVK